MRHEISSWLLLKPAHGRGENSFRKPPNHEVQGQTMTPLDRSSPTSHEKVK